MKLAYIYVLLLVGLCGFSCRGQRTDGSQRTDVEHDDAAGGEQPPTCTVNCQLPSTGENLSIPLYGGPAGPKGQKGETGGPGGAGLPGLSGRDGTPGLPGLSGAKGDAGRKGEPGSDAVPTKVAFSVARSSFFGPFSSYRTVPFQHSLTNIGGHFNLASGVFTSPVKGHYYININVHKRRNSGAGPFVLLKKNDQTVLRVDECCDEDPYDTATNSAIIPMDSGDTLSLTLVDGRTFSASDGKEATFNGFLLYKD